MKIALIGYGKMGKTIESIAVSRGHVIGMIIDIDNAGQIDELRGRDIQAAIEFSNPGAAFHNIWSCIDQGIPVVSGTTGWLSKLPEINRFCLDKKGAFLYASNFSIGVNLFFLINKLFAGIMNAFPDYEVSIEEIHHTEKLDAPSGTAISLVESIIKQLERKNNWSTKRGDPGTIMVTSKREAQVAGIHSITYGSKQDRMVLTHEAFSREGFAVGAIQAAEWLLGKQGVYNIEDMLRDVIPGIHPDGN